MAKPTYAWTPGDTSARCHGEIALVPAWTKGTFQWGRLGHQVGIYYATERLFNRPHIVGRPILNAGSIQMGHARVLLCFCIDRKEVFIGKPTGEFGQFRVGQVRAHLDMKCPEPKSCERDHLIEWADEMQRRFLSRYLTPGENQVVATSVRLYHRLCHALLGQVVLEAASHGFELTKEQVARAASEDWSVRDLCAPRWPSIDHALLFCQACALPHEQAASLVELAWSIQMRRACSRAVASLVVAEAYRELSMLVPGWLTHGASYDWRFDGSIEAVNRAHAARVLGEAAARDLPFHVVSGSRLANAIRLHEASAGDLTHMVKHAGLPDMEPEEVGEDGRPHPDAWRRTWVDTEAADDPEDSSEE